MKYLSFGINEKYSKVLSLKSISSISIFIALKKSFMKKYFLLVLVLSFSAVVSGQSVFEKYQNNKEVTAISISPKMFQLLGSMSLSSGDPEADALMEMIKGITNFRALITSKEMISDEIDLWVKEEAGDKDLDLMVSVRESDTDLNVYVKEGEVEGMLKSLLMFSKGVSNAVPEAKIQGSKIEAVLLLIEGDIELDKIAKLISKMNLPGGDQLKMSGI
ncbi:MAG: DUF4252 domain-containing protein [Flavobacteriaceae bacterium TMED42]|nr:MAG: DUF4252 domain-containing protein [Flavobacteriaceae bacterium TMED42]|tara:strand:- start:6816 stop:7469 length:654 start_codon:yes stop_codon:yes gene_type:complete